MITHKQNITKNLDLPLLQPAQNFGISSTKSLPSFPPPLLGSRNKRLDKERNIQIKDIEIGIEFILSHFQYIIFPRKISTLKSQNSQIMILDKEEILKK